MMKQVLAALGMAAAWFCGGCRTAESTADIPAVGNFELDRYLGTWYEIARLPHRFERDLEMVTAHYSLRPDGKIEVVNRGRRDGVEHVTTGVAVPAGDPGTGELRVSFFWPFWGEYRIIHLEPDYSSAVVTSGTRDHLWILARTRTLARETLERYLEMLRRRGFAAEKLEYPAPRRD